MGKIQQHIEIVSSSIPSLSSMSKASRDAVQSVLSQHYQQVGITLVDTPRDLSALVAKAPDLVFLGMKFVRAEPDSTGTGTHKIWLAEYLADHGIATTGSQSVAHRLELSKPLAKKCIQYAGLNTADYFVAKVGQPLSPHQVTSDYPLFVKPANRGGGLGIDTDSVVRTFEQLQAKVRAIANKHGSHSLVEKYLPGREFSVAVIKRAHRSGYSAMPLELIAPSDSNGLRILSDAIKSADAEDASIVSDPHTARLLSDFAINAFRTIGGRDYGRIDIRMDEHGMPHFLEANLIPSLIANYGSFPKACLLHMGLGYEEMLLRIVDLGMARVRPAEEIMSKALTAPVLL